MTQKRKSKLIQKQDLKPNGSYSPDEARVAKYLYDLSEGKVGAGDDPIGFLIASHRTLSEENRRLAESLYLVRKVRSNY